MTDPNEFPERITPPAGAPFTDLATGVVWAALSALPAAGMHEIADRLGSLLACGPTNSPQQLREHRAVSAIREAHALAVAAGKTGPLSVETFRVLRQQHAAAGWPPDGSIRTWLGGSWNDALRRAGLEAHPDGDVLHVAWGQRDYTDQEILDAVQLCARMLDQIPTFSQYVGWTRRAEVISLPGRRPRAQAVFDRLGGWTSTLTKAGLIVNDDSGAAVSKYKLRPSAYRYQPEQVASVLRECAADLGRSPRSQEYIRWRLLRQHHDANRALPTYTTFCRALNVGTWDEVLIAAGLMPLGGRATRSNSEAGPRASKPRFSDADLRHWLVQAYEQLGDPFTGRAFRTWRTAEIHRLREQRIWTRVPSYDTYWQRFGTWQNALRACLGDQPEGAS